MCVTSTKHFLFVFTMQATIKKEMIKKGMLDKYGKPNEKTPEDYLSSSVAQVALVTPKKEKEDFVIPSSGPEPPKRKVRALVLCLHYVQ